MRTTVACIALVAIVTLAGPAWAQFDRYVAPSARPSSTVSPIYPPAAPAQSNTTTVYVPTNGGNNGTIDYGRNDRLTQPAPR